MALKNLLILDGMTSENECDEARNYQWEDGNELDMRYEPKSMSKIYLKFDLQHFIYFNTSDISHKLKVTDSKQRI
jgi:hypothetical protein